jgi:hypothetical protein
LHPNLLAALLITFVLVDILYVNLFLIQGRSRADWLDKYQPLAQTLLDNHVTRLYSPNYSFPQQAAAYWHIPQFGGVDPFQVQSFITMFELATGTKYSHYSITLPPFEGDIKTANRDARIAAQRLGIWSVSHVLSGFPIESNGLELIQTTSDGLFLYENKWSTRQRRSISWHDPNTLSASNGSDIAMNIAPWFPGWTLSENALLVKNAIRIVIAPPKQGITAHYETPTFIPAISFFIGGLLLSLTLLFGKNRYPL